MAHSDSDRLMELLIRVQNLGRRAVRLNPPILN